jgi:hypothetical protein
MSRLLIEFDDHTKNADDMLIPVDVLDHRFERVAQTVLRMPANGEVTVPGPGLYLVRADLPTGEPVSITVRVDEATDTGTARLTAAESSPRETLAWAYAQQSVKQFSGALPPSKPRPKRAKESGFESFSLEDAPGAPAAPLARWPFVRVVETYRQDTAGPEWRFVPSGSTVTTDRDVAKQDPRLLRQATVRVPPEDRMPERCCPIYVLRGVTSAQGSPESLDMIALPTTTDPTLLFVRNEAEGQGIGAVRTLVRGAGKNAEGLLAYLDQGAISAARRIGDEVIKEAVELMEDKRDNPFGAAIGGYFLLSARSVERWAWMKNLADWFPMIPDGPIIYGVSCLRDESADNAEGRHYLLQAVARGIPTYTVGLRLLFDALRGLAQEGKDDEVEAALTRVRHIAAYSDWTSQTTTFSFPRQSDPFPVTLDPEPLDLLDHLADSIRHSDAATVDSLLGD